LRYHNYLKTEGRNRELSSHITKCELEALRTGTELADSFNSLLEDASVAERLYQDFIAERLGFFHPVLLKGLNDSGLTTSKTASEELQRKGGWVNNSSTSYDLLNNKWIYFNGDSTVRMVYGSFLVPPKGIEFEKNLKKYSRTECSKQYPRRKKGTVKFCGQNEVTCTVQGFGDRGILSFDWKHFMLEDYDKWLLGGTGPWNIDRSLRRPDVFIIQTGLHTCYHAFHEKYTDMIENDLKAIPQLMGMIQTAISRHHETNISQDASTVIFMTSGRRFGLPERDACVWRMNRAVTMHAHTHGFFVLEREEIERRFLYKSEYAATFVANSTVREVPVELNDGHLGDPASHIVATALLSLIKCASASSANPNVTAENTPHAPESHLWTTFFEVPAKQSLHKKVLVISNKTTIGGTVDVGTGSNSSSLPLLSAPQYVVDTGGFKRLITNTSCLEVLHINTWDRAEVSREDFDAIPFGPPFPSAVCAENIAVRVDDERAVYVIVNATARVASGMNVLGRVGISAESIRVVPLLDLEMFTKGGILH
jgi:hypothetical protein